MPRIKLTQQQEELIAVFPLAITKSDTFKRLSNAQKLVLAQIDLQDGTDFSEENGYSFASNKDLMDKTGISSEHTVINAVKTLVNEGLIVTQRGRRDKNGSMASEYVLTDKYYGLCDRENPHKKLLQYMDCNKNNQGCNKGCNNSMEGCNKDCNNITAINPTVEAMQQEISELKKIINELQNQLQKSYCSTDTDIDTDIDTCISENVNKKKIYNRDCNNYTVPVDNTVNDDILFKKKKLNKKEKGNTDSDGTVESDNNFSNFTDMEENTIQRQGEQASNSKSYDDVINAVVNRINKGQSFSEKRLRDYVFEQFISKGTATSEQWDSDFKFLQRLKDFHGDVAEDTVTPSSKDAEEDNELNTLNDMKELQNTGLHSNLHQAIAPFRGESDSEPPHSPRTPLDKGSLSEDNSPDGQEYHEEEKCAQDANQTPKTATNHVCSYEEYLEQHLMWGKISSSGFAVEHFIEVAHPFVDSGDVTEEQYQRDLASLRQLSGYVTETELLGAITSDPLVPYGVSAEQ